MYEQTAAMSLLLLAGDVHGWAPLRAKVDSMLWIRWIVSEPKFESMPTM